MPAASKSLLGSVCLVALTAPVFAGPYAPRAGLTGSTAISKYDPLIAGWASGVVAGSPGPQSATAPDGPAAAWGWSPDDGISPAIGVADAEGDSLPVVSLGDGGWITLSFLLPITDGPGADFAVFENGIYDPGTNKVFLELAFVEVSSNGNDFFRFPSVSLTQTSAQIGTFGLVDPTDVYNLAGKYERGYGTPFDLAELDGVSPKLDVHQVRYVRVVDVVGSILPEFAQRDSLGNIINDPWRTSFETGGFDLDAVAVLHQIPEPSLAGMLAVAGAFGFSRRRRGNRQQRAT